MRPLDRDHLMRLKMLCDRYAPESFSEHLAWSSHDDVYLNDLLPLPYTPQTLARVAEHVDEVQTVLGRQMLLENPSTYIRFSESTIPEVDFLTEVSSANRMRFAARHQQRLRVGNEPRHAASAHIWTCFRSIG